MATAMLHSLDPNGTHEADLQPMKVVDKGNVMPPPSGVKRHAPMNPFCGCWFADHMYRVVNDTDVKGSGAS